MKEEVGSEKRDYREETWRRRKTNSRTRESTSEEENKKRGLEGEE